LRPTPAAWGGFAACGGESPGALVTAFAVQRLSKKAGRPRTFRMCGAGALVTACAVKGLSNSQVAAAAPPKRRLAFKPVGVRPVCVPFADVRNQATA